jgi:hypothetical protein
MLLFKYAHIIIYFSLLTSLGLKGYAQENKKKIKTIKIYEHDYKVFSFYESGNLKEAYTKTDSMSKINSTYYLFNPDGQLLEETIYMNKSNYYSYNKDNYVTNCYRVKKDYKLEKYITDTISHTMYVYNMNNNLVKEFRFYRNENGKINYNDTGLIIKYSYKSKDLINCTSVESKKVKTENGYKIIKEESYLFKYLLTFNTKNQVIKAELFFGNDTKGTPYFIFDYDSTGRKAKINTIRHGKRTKFYRYDYINIPFCIDAFLVDDPKSQEYLLDMDYKRLLKTENIKITYEYY